MAPLIGEATVVRQVEGLAVRHLADALVAEKVCYRVLDLLRRHDSVKRDELARDAVFAAHMARLQTVAIHRTVILAALDEAARERAVAVWAIKGLCARGWYAEPDLRDLGDLDLMVGSVDDAVRVMVWLRDRGYTFEWRELPWLKRWPPTGHLYGQFRLTSSALPSIDLHFGGYSVRHCGLHRLDQPDRVVGLSYSGRQATIPVLIANAAGDHRITTKDVNDLLYCLDGKDVRWREVLAELESVALAPFFHVMLRRLRDGCRLTVAQRQTVDGMLAATRPEWPEPATRRRWERRWLATVLHAFRLGRRQSGGRAISNALTACRYYWTPRQLRVGPRRWRVARMPALDSRTCVRLVPVELLERILTRRDEAPLGPSFVSATGPSEALSAELRRVRSRRGDIVRSTVGDFLPVVYDRLDRRLASLVDGRP